MAALFPFSLTDLLRLTRFWNLTIVALTQFFTGIFLLDTQLWHDWQLWAIIFSTTAIAAAGYIINDYYDVKIDLINKPERVVVGKSVTRRYALLFHSALNGLAIATGFWVSWRVGVIHFFSAFLLWLYSNQLKRQPLVGNVAVAFLTGLTVELIAIFYHANQPLITVYAIFAFFMTLVREIIKDMEDWRGDATFGCQTLPIVWGLRKTRRFIYALLAVFLAVVVVLNFLFAALPGYFLAALSVPLGALVYRLHRADTIAHFGQLSMLCKVIMLLGIFSMVFVR
jgi:4-hydroxybenzoate polyprenyltransferase